MGGDVLKAGSYNSSKQSRQGQIPAMFPDALLAKTLYKEPIHIPLAGWPLTGRKSPLLPSSCHRRLHGGSATIGSGFPAWTAHHPHSPQDSLHHSQACHHWISGRMTLPLSVFTVVVSVLTMEAKIPRPEPREDDRSSEQPSLWRWFWSRRMSQTDLRTPLTCAERGTPQEEAVLAREKEERCLVGFRSRQQGNTKN